MGTGMGQCWQNILRQMVQFYGDYLEILIFQESVILHEPIEVEHYQSLRLKPSLGSQRWPQCDCLVSFHASGFPLDKAIAYAKLNPHIFVLNDLVRQYDLLDRFPPTLHSHHWPPLAGWHQGECVQDPAAGGDRAPPLCRPQKGGAQQEWSASTHLPSIPKRRGSFPDDKLVESHDQIEIDGEVFLKPFVEKPVRRS